MRLVIFLGPPGVGKGTQCALLSVRLGFKHISTGAIIRKEIQSQSSLGLRVKSIVESGNFVDDDTIFLCLEKAFDELNCAPETTILLDGLPRSLAQAKQLNSLVRKKNFETVQVICLEAETELLVKRFERRFTCSACGNVESLNLQNGELTSMNAIQCQFCHGVGTLVRRKDDEPVTVRHRQALYQTETLPLVSFYKELNIISFVDGLMPPECVYVKVASFLI